MKKIFVYFIWLENIQELDQKEGHVVAKVAAAAIAKVAAI